MKLFKISILFSVISSIPTSAIANNTGTDLNLSVHAIAGSMGGAAYTKPQEASSAVFGNPATLSQFKGNNYDFGVSLLQIKEVKNTQTTTLTSPINNTYSNTSISSADNYVLPTVAGVLQLSDNAFIGFGFEVDAGIGADFREDPITLLGGAGEALVGSKVSLPLNIELISFNGNIAGAYQITPELSLGASVTIGFGLAQFGTTGDTQGLDELGTPLGGAVYDFGGTTSSVHDTSFAASIGVTYQSPSGISYSATLKSSLKYKFENILYGNTVNNSYEGYQDMSVEQPLETIIGVAFDDYFAQDVLIEADVIWKNWSDANSYKDLYDDQYLYVLGVQFRNVLPNLDLRFGYSYAENPLLNETTNSIDNLKAAGSLPLGTNAENLGLTPLANDIVKIVQMTLVPVVWQQTVSAGFGYQLTNHTSLNFYTAISSSENDSRELNNVDAILETLGITAETKHTVELKPEVSYGLSIKMLIP